MTEDELNAIERRRTGHRMFLARGTRGGHARVSKYAVALCESVRDAQALLAEVRALRAGLTFLSENGFLAADVNSHYAACVLDGTVNEEQW